MVYKSIYNWGFRTGVSTGDCDGLRHVTGVS